jgi:hypothetical protein
MSALNELGPRGWLFSQLDYLREDIVAQRLLQVCEAHLI